MKRRPLEPQAAATSARRRFASWAAFRPTQLGAFKSSTAAPTLTLNKPSIRTTMATSEIPIVVVRPSAAISAPPRTAAPPPRPPKNPARQANRQDLRAFELQAAKSLASVRPAAAPECGMAPASAQLDEFRRAQAERQAAELSRRLNASLRPLAQPHPLEISQDGWKFEADEQLHAQLRLPATVRIRSTFSDRGFRYTSNSVAAGGFGKVQVAIDLNGQLMAVKVIHVQERRALAREPGKPTATQGLCYEAIAHEVQALAELSEHIEVFGTMVWRDKIFVSMTLMKNDALGMFKRLEANQRSGAARLAYADVLAQVVNLHAKSRIHGDLKWENVLTNAQGIFALSDFSFVKKLDADGAWRGRTLQGSFFPPEFAKVTGSVPYAYTRASDLFALGASLGDALLPFETNPLYSHTAPDGRIAWATEAGSPKAFSRWYKTILNEDGAVDLTRVRPHGYFGNYYTRLRRHDPALCFWALQHLLPPNPNARSSAAQALQALIALPTAIDLTAARIDVAAMPPPIRQQQAEAALKAVYRSEVLKQSSRQPLWPLSLKFW